MNFLTNIILAKINEIIFCCILGEMYNLHLSITKFYIAISMYMSGKD